MCLTILLLIFGIAALAKGEFKITGGRKVKGSIGRALGVVMLIGAGALFVPEYGSTIQLGVLILVIIIGLATSEKIMKEPATSSEASKTEPSMSVGDISTRIGYDVRDLLMAGYTQEEIDGILEGKYSLEELLDRGPAAKGNMGE